MSPSIMLLRPIKPDLTVRVWAGLLLNPLGLLIAWPSVRDRPATVVFFCGVAVLFGLPIQIAWHSGLKRVPPAPPEAVVEERRLSRIRLAVSIGFPILITIWSLLGTQTPAVLGIGFGAALGSIGAVRKVGQFESTDGRWLARDPNAWRGGSRPALYAVSPKARA